MAHFDFTKKYSGIDNETINIAIKHVTEVNGICGFNETILATTDKPPKALIFRRIKRTRLSSDVSPDDYSFMVHED